MPRPDLRALFRDDRPDLVAEEVFADRCEEWGAVLRGLERTVANARDPSFDVADFQSPRRNVLVFYGVGGIGKTALSRSLVERLSDSEDAPKQWPPPDPGLGRLLPVRIDLSAQHGADLEAVVLAVRLAVAELGRPMRAFDLAFQRYWQHAHPTEPLEDYLRRHTFLGRWFSHTALRGQFASALTDVAQALLLPGTMGSLTGEVTRAVVTALRRRRSKNRALAGCTRLADLLEADADLEALSFYAHLLAWDLAQVPAQHRATPVVLLDTFEDVDGAPGRELERGLQRMAWLMPNALFVITGRNRLRWDGEDHDDELDWVGTHHWPLLGPGAREDPRQHRVGFLSDHDCQDYLRRRLTVDGAPLMGEAVRARIVERSQGLPLYLDLAVMRYLELYHRIGHAPDVEEFNYDFPALVSRTFRDLTGPERQVLRAVSLLDSFSVDLAAAGAGSEFDAPVLRLVERPFIENDPSALWPYRLHNLVRSAVQEADSTSEDGWSEADWRRAAQRLHEALGREYDTHRADGDRTRLLASLRQGLRLAHEHGLELGWLVNAAFSYVRDFVWEPFPADTAQAMDSAAAALAETLAAISARQREHRATTVERLEHVLRTGLLPEELRELPRYFIAECHRDLGHRTESLDGMRAISQAGGRLAPDASRGLVHLSRRLGRFPDVQAAAERLDARGRKDRTLGDLWWTQGKIALACAHYGRGRDAALERHEPGEAALAQACLAFAAAFQDPPRAQEEIARAEELLRGRRARFAELQVANARLLCDAGADETLPQRAEDVAARAADNGLTSSAAYARLAACFHATITGEEALTALAQERLGECLHGEEFAYLLELAHFMADGQPQDSASRAQWLDGVDRTAARWRTLVHDRRRALDT